MVFNECKQINFTFLWFLINFSSFLTNYTFLTINFQKFDLNQQNYCNNKEISLAEFKIR